MKAKKSSQIISLLLTVVMLVGMLPISSISSLAAPAQAAQTSYESEPNWYSLGTGPSEDTELEVLSSLLRHQPNNEEANEKNEVSSDFAGLDYLYTGDTLYIKLTTDINVEYDPGDQLTQLCREWYQAHGSWEYPSDKLSYKTQNWHRDLPVYGKKVIDLNGHTIKVKNVDPYNGGSIRTKNQTADCVLKIENGATLTVVDSKGGGKMATDTYIYGTGGGDVYDLFHVKSGGELILNAPGATFECGRSKKQWYGAPAKNGEGHSDYQSFYVRGQSNGTVVTVTSGKLTVAGGALYGRGFSYVSEFGTNWEDHKTAYGDAYYENNPSEPKRCAAIIAEGESTVHIIDAEIIGKGCADAMQIRGRTDLTIESGVFDVNKVDKVAIPEAQYQAERQTNGATIINGVIGFVTGSYNPNYMDGSDGVVGIPENVINRLSAKGSAVEVLWSDRDVSGDELSDESTELETDETHKRVTIRPKSGSATQDARVTIEPTNGMYRLNPVRNESFKVNVSLNERYFTDHARELAENNYREREGVVYGQKDKDKEYYLSYKFTLYDSDGKKVSFLGQACVPAGTTSLTGVELVGMRDDSTNTYPFTLADWNQLKNGKYTVRCEVTEVWKGEHTYKSAWYSTMPLTIQRSNETNDPLTVLLNNDFKPDFDINHTWSRGVFDGVPVMSLVLTDETQAALKDAMSPSLVNDFNDITVTYTLWDYDPDGNIFEQMSQAVHANEYVTIISNTTGAKVITATIGIPYYEGGIIKGYNLIETSKNFLLLPAMDKWDGDTQYPRYFDYHDAAELSENQSAGLSPINAVSETLKNKGSFSWQWYLCVGGHDMYEGEDPTSHSNSYSEATPNEKNSYVRLTQDGTYRLVCTYQPEKAGSPKQEFMSVPIDVDSENTSRVQVTLAASTDSLTFSMDELFETELTLNCTGMTDEIESVQFSMKGYPDGMYSRPVVKEKNSSDEYTISLAEFESLAEAVEDGIDASGEYTFRAFVNCKEDGWKKYKVYSDYVTVTIEKEAEGYALVANGQYLGAGGSSEYVTKQAIPLYLDSANSTVTLSTDYYPKNATYDSKFLNKGNITYQWVVPNGANQNVISLLTTQKSNSPAVKATIKQPGTTVILMRKSADGIVTDTYFKVCVPVTKVEFEQPDYQNKIGNSYKNIAPSVKAYATCGAYIVNAFDFTYSEEHSANYAPVYRDNGTNSDVSKVITANDKGDVVYKFHLADGQSYPLTKLNDTDYAVNTSAVQLTIKTDDGDIAKAADKWGATDGNSMFYSGNVDAAPNNAYFQLAQDVFVKDKNAEYIDVVTLTTTEPGVGDEINEKVESYDAYGTLNDESWKIYGSACKKMDVFSLSGVKTAEGKPIILPNYSRVSKATAETAGAPYTDAEGAKKDGQKSWEYGSTFLNGGYENGTYFNEIQLVTNPNTAADGKKYYFAPNCKIILNGHLLDFGDRTTYYGSGSSLSFKYFFDVGEVNNVDYLTLSGLTPQQGNTPAEPEAVTATGYDLSDGNSSTTNAAEIDVTKLIWFVDVNKNKTLDDGEEVKVKWKTTTNAEGEEEITGYDADNSTLWWDGTFLPGVAYSAVVEIGSDDNATRLSENIEVEIDGKSITLIGGQKQFVVTFDADNTIRTIHIPIPTGEAAADPKNRDPLGLFNASNQGYTSDVASVYNHKPAYDDVSALDRDISNFYEGGTDLSEQTLTEGKYWMILNFTPKNGCTFANDVKVLINGVNTGEFGYGKEQVKEMWMVSRTNYTNVWRTFIVPAGETPSAGVSVSGTVTSFGSDTDDVTIQLIESGMSEPAYEAVVKGNSASYSIANVVAGTYTMKVMKKDHVTREYTIQVVASNMTQDAEIHLLGDVNGDGKVNTKDWAMLYDHVNETSKLSDYLFACGDVNGDGKLNTKDWAMMYDHITETKPLW